MCTFYARDFLLKLSTDGRLHPDVRILSFDARWCLDESDADRVATDMSEFMQSVRSYDSARQPVDPLQLSPEK